MDEQSVGYFVVECRYATLNSSNKAVQEMRTRLSSSGSMASLNDHIKDIITVAHMKGYVIVKAITGDENRQIFVDQLVGRMGSVPGFMSAKTPMRNAKRVIGEIEEDEVIHCLQPKSPMKGMSNGSLIEITKGAFTGEVARIITIDEKNNVVMAELFEAAVPLRLKLKPNMVRMVD